MKILNLARISGALGLGVMAVMLSGCNKTEGLLGGGALGTAAGAGIGYAIDGGAGGAALGGVLGGLTGAAIGHHVGEDQDSTSKQRQADEAYYRQQKLHDEAEMHRREKAEIRRLEQELQRERLELERERIHREKERLRS
ncbi:MAG: hypothetical protein LBG98_02970 [Puniceicoccales bacterium]|jgi:uncharacterized protein YcfJ|nr:hypothetical protein [Puniceicoccales bacterium]